MSSNKMTFVQVVRLQFCSSLKQRGKEICRRAAYKTLFRNHTVSFAVLQDVWFFIIFIYIWKRSPLDGPDGPHLEILNQSLSGLLFRLHLPFIFNYFLMAF